MSELSAEQWTVDRRRRQLIAGAAALAAAPLLSTPRRVRAQGVSLETARLRDDVAVIFGPDSNAPVCDASDGIVLIDGGHERWARQLLETADDLFPGRPIRALVNSHWHREQTGANLILGPQGTEIVAHENTRLWLGIDIRQRWSGQTFEPLPADARPVTALHDDTAIQFGDRVFDFGYMLHAHTDGDIWTGIPDADVLATGGVVSNAGWPIVDWWTGGWIVGLLNGLDRLVEASGDDTLIVPGSGPLMTREDLLAQREMYNTIFDRLQEMLRDARSADEVVAARPTAEYDEGRGDPELFLRLAFESMNRHLRDVHDRRLGNIA